VFDLVQTIYAFSVMFVEHCHKEYDGNVPNYNIKNYGL